MNCCYGFFLVLLACAMSAEAGELGGENPSIQPLSEQDRRAKFNYQMFCQGCHTPEGRGYNSIPALSGSMHRFMATQQGRSYLVQVPGSANAPLNNADLTELLNWMLIEFSFVQDRTNNAATWQPYTQEEVAEYRQSPLYETVEYRKQVLKNLLKEQ